MFKAFSRAAIACALLVAVIFSGVAHAHGRAQTQAATSIAWRDSVPAKGAAAVLSIAARFLGQSDPTHIGAPWCASFVNFVLRQAGYHPHGSLMAIDALRDGQRVSTPQPGDLAVMRGHITFFAGYAGPGRFVGLGGNQGHRVKYSQFAIRRVVAWVRPT